MGYATYVYAVDLRRLKAAFGSGDEALFRRIKKRNAKIWRHNERVSADAIGEGEPSDEQALREFIEGRITRPEHAPAYGYALKSVCADLGAGLGELPDVRDLKLDSPLEQPRLPVLLPPNDDWPVVSYLTSQEVVREAKRVAAADLSHAEKWLERERRRYAAFLEAARERKSGVVTFYA